jgi:hypothetical protein
LSAYQLIEVAFLSARGLILHEKGEIAFIELLKPVIPGNLLQFLGAAIAREIQADHADIFRASGSAHAGRSRVALFRPAANFFRFGQCSG